MKTECLEYEYDDIFGEYDYDDCVKSSERIECPDGQVTHKSEPCQEKCYEKMFIPQADIDGQLTCVYTDHCDKDKNYL